MNEDGDQLPLGWVRIALAEIVDGAQSGFASGEKAVVGGCNIFE